MTDEKLTHLKYPIGKYRPNSAPDADQLNDWMLALAQLPEVVASLTESLTEKELNYVYRPGGWTIQQVVHHLADSHMNSFIRFKLALTEEAPTIRPYMEDRWANLPDVNAEPIASSLSILKGVHSRLIRLIRSMDSNDLQRTFIHPEHGKLFTLVETIGLYAWHSRHHTAHIRQALENKGAFQ